MNAPDINEIRSAFQALEEERRFWQHHYEEFRATYPDQFVAVRDGDIVATGKDLQEMTYRLRELGIDIRSTWVRFIESDPSHFQLLTNQHTGMLHLERI